MRLFGFLLAAALVWLDLTGTVRFVAITTIAISWAVATRTAGGNPRGIVHYLYTWIAGCLTAAILSMSEVSDPFVWVFIGLLYGTWASTAAWLIVAGGSREADVSQDSRLFNLAYERLRRGRLPEHVVRDLRRKGVESDRAATIVSEASEKLETSRK